MVNFFTLRSLLPTPAPAAVVHPCDGLIKAARLGLAAVVLMTRGVCVAQAEARSESSIASSMFPVVRLRAPLGLWAYNLLRYSTGRGYNIFSAMIYIRYA